MVRKDLVQVMELHVVDENIFQFLVRRKDLSTLQPSLLPYDCMAIPAVIH